jgi:hypothetical protein
LHSEEDWAIINALLVDTSVWIGLNDREWEMGCDGSYSEHDTDAKEAFETDSTKVRAACDPPTPTCAREKEPGPVLGWEVTPSTTYHFTPVDVIPGPMVPPGPGGGSQGRGWSPEGGWPPESLMGWSIVADDQPTSAAALTPLDWYMGAWGKTGISSGICDEDHTTLITRSPEMWGPISFTAMIVGGFSVNHPGKVGTDDQNIADGFIGLALRKVSDGSYVGSVHAKCGCNPHGPGGLDVVLEDSAFAQCGGVSPNNCPDGPEFVSLPPTGVAGEKYTIDIIDNYVGSWFGTDSLMHHVRVSLTH